MYGLKPVPFKRTHYRTKHHSLKLDGPLRLDDSDQIFDASLFHLLVESADGVLFKVGTGAMRGQRFFIAILLIDEKRFGVAFNGVRNIADASRLLRGRQRPAAAAFP